MIHFLIGFVCGCSITISIITLFIFRIKKRLRKNVTTVNLIVPLFFKNGEEIDEKYLSDYCQSYYETLKN
jgi:hypothetical protein